MLLTREHQDGRLVALAEFRAGGLFGELAMFRGETRSATAEAIEDTTAVALLAGDMQRLVRRNPDLALKLLAALAERVSTTTERLLQQSFQTVAGRVAGTLLAQCVTRQAEGAAERDVLIRGHPGRDRAALRHLARERQPLPRHARARRAGHPRAGEGDRA